METTQLDRLQWRAVRQAVITTLIGVLPSFLLAGLAAQAAEELLFTESQLGTAMSGYFMVAALASGPAGKLVERFGTIRGTALCTAISGLAMLGIAAFAFSWVTLTAFLLLGGFASALAHPSANLMLARTVRSTRQGLAFGIKQAAVPSATFLSGVAVPVIGLTVGWRWAFATAAALAFVYLVYALIRTPGELRVRPAPSRAAPSLDAASRGSLWLLVVAAALGTAAGNALATFTVVASIVQGLSPAYAGLLFSLASFTGISVRVLAGWAADRRELPHLPMVIVMMSVAAGAFLLLSVGAGAVVFVIGAVVGFGASWGWQGILTFAVVLRHGSQPAAATGLLQGGIGAGGVIGPASVGTLIERVSYSAAWGLCASFGMVAAILGLSVWIRDRRPHEESTT